MEQNDEDRRLKKRYEAAVRKMQEDAQRREFARRVLEADAYERLMNIKVKNDGLYEQVLSLLVSFVQQKGMSSKISDKELVVLLHRFTDRHEPTISFRHK